MLCLGAAYGAVMVERYGRARGAGYLEAHASSRGRNTPETFLRRVRLI